MRPDGNLLCLFGKNGSGKTRMLQQVEALLGEGEVLRTGAETVVNDLVEALSENGSYDDVALRFRDIDSLLVDNIFVLASRPNSAAVVREIIRSRMNADRFTILASDLSLEQWAVKQPEMATLLSSGTMVQLS